MCLFDAIIYSQVVAIISSMLLVFWRLYLFVKAYKAGEAIKAKTYELGKGLTDEKVLDYCAFVDGIQIPNRRVYWNTLKTGYRLVEMDNSVSDESRDKLRVTMLSRGVLLE